MTLLFNLIQDVNMQIGNILIAPMVGIYILILKCSCDESSYFQSDFEKGYSVHVKRLKNMKYSILYYVSFWCEKCPLKR